MLVSIVVGSGGVSAGWFCVGYCCDVNGIVGLLCVCLLGLFVTAARLRVAA